MMDSGHNRDSKQCRVKLKELRQAYQKTREANGRSGSEPQTCHCYDELQAILWVQPPLPQPCCLTPSMEIETTRKQVLGDEEDDDDDEVVDSKQAEKPIFPTARNCFSPWTWSQYPLNPPKAASWTRQAEKGPLAACVSRITGSSSSQRLVKIRRRKKRTRDEMFSELMLSSHTDRAQTNAWRQTMSECRKAQNDREERWQAEDSKWRAEERAEAERWPQHDERRQDSMLRLLEDQTNMLQHMVELQERQLEHRPPPQPLCNQPPSSPSSIASSPRRPRTWWGRPPATQPLHPRGLPKQQKAGIQ
ncbi:uncharacterized protein LOC141978669 [Natator depressus]|uniref:uncharacterized protein LOC141978669 n=1 Tax=Natator depressus TaxID=27790 RepID=UPI003EB6B538